ncbi:hypothetical protein [Bacillus sp. SA1-12]|uniref:hypothetical protein n=1 Tax=Bacillus sp. SA1-12 TaxID=1455638 RepID=UPI000696817C|nr:hypothetical protein [Bacillus sp. SA1-12]
MRYIIDNATIVKANGLEKTSLLINKNKIEFMRKKMDNIRFMRMDMSTYLLTPGYVMLDFSLHSLLHFQQFKQYMIHQYMKKGCTSLLTIEDIQFEHELGSNLKQKRQLMINSPIDYYIGIKIPFNLLSPSIIRKCKQQQIAVVFVEIDETDELSTKSWGWIRDAMFSNPITLIPFLKKNKEFVHKKSKQLFDWERIMKEHRLSSIITPLEEGVPISKDVLMRLGIYPEKGDIRVGGQVNYNLYNLSEIRYHTDGKPAINALELHPAITAHQGRLINVNGETSFIPGIGVECFIPISGRFIPLSVSF